MGKVRKIEVKESSKVKFDVKETIKDTSKMKSFLISEWCDCYEHGKQSEFLCYPKDGCCTCGVYKHHVHCANCGRISQVG